ncbi:magnesium protoporphyrin IX methyltransferase, chloroplastic-like [Chenopodium quinoa]|uniref:Magnesium-protoporphyrin IX methyltransferase C-terminal domain-containing protein n=1 Tax=Chenopodium quinoa TaxID=63459 RepID=A0A803N7E1_CHEQI|nr:magnesium protoporphyrin IX methyltransferase, chloroplastic-like [Chenopodium quinoa]XP_021719257.1 magnesium protoporphyrin IX methyltransferase, chloroplastic-like [Chenopodium quinoa]XP_021719264.1 magnesium protoporphyrin IX methyltransferase, chloroplastic-like [Chenopodium quinoa]XP_021719273.1 magnesium protoporphyrin IX methyltransferase, chloroplastic-like [Chenopodium quinoa]
MASLATTTTLSLNHLTRNNPTTTFSLHPHKRRLTPPPLSALPPLLSTITDIDSNPTTLAVIGGGSLAASIAALAALLSLTDPEKRRQQQAEVVGGSDKEVVREYFNGTGFQRWKKIYGETDDVNKVQLDIRIGHAKTVESVVMMLKEDGSLSGVSVCDAGCGTGSLSIPLAKEGALVCASDISAAMVQEAQAKAKEELQITDTSPSSNIVMPKFEVKDLESLDGKYDTVVCLDVLIHYPQDKADAMIGHLASLAENRLILSFAPKTFFYSLLKRIGELFPGPSKATRAYLHAEADVERALQKAGWKIRKRGLTTTQFYFAKIVEAVPA